MGTPDKTENLRLGGTTYSWLHQESLTAALHHLACAGFDRVEITTAAPHIQSSSAGILERHELLNTLRDLELAVTSVNPGFMDINLLSPSNEFRRVSLQAMMNELELASDLGAPILVTMPGRRHALSPAPDEACRWWLDQALEKLIDRGERLGVAIGLETNPYGYLGSAAELTGIVDGINSPWLGITYDVANTINMETPADGVKTVAKHLILAHVSDTLRERWAHTSPGRGDVDFGSYAQALRDVGYTGTTVYELVDMEPVGDRLHRDVEQLAKYGWQTMRPRKNPM